MGLLNERHNTTIEKQDLHSLQKAFYTLVDMEIECERKLEMIREVKARVLIEIDFKLPKKR